jgi:hypothetical protein
VAAIGILIDDNSATARSLPTLRPSGFIEPCLPGATVFQHACRMGLEGDRGEAGGPALSVRALPGLGEGQEPGRAKPVPRAVV